MCPANKRGAKRGALILTIGIAASGCGDSKADSLDEPSAADADRVVATHAQALAAGSVGSEGASGSANPLASKPEYTLFESGPVRPLALSPSGRTLFATNIPNGTLEVFDVTKRGLAHLGSVAVGLEPVAVAAASDRVAWVVNHLSDSVSIVELDRAANVGAREGEDEQVQRLAEPATAASNGVATDVSGRIATDLASARTPPRPPSGRVIGRVVQTLLVGDEPRDIVLGGRDRTRAFITTAHRGQNAPYDPKLTTAGQDRADVWVFDTESSRDTTLGGSPLAILTLFTDTPRALAASPDGRRIYAAGFHTGNRTTVVLEPLVPDEPLPPDNLAVPLPRTNHAGIEQPQTGLIVKFDGEHWVDEDGKAWDHLIRFSLPDKDVFVIDADAPVPRLRQGRNGFFSGVGTVLFNMIVNPRNGRVYVSNTDARNEVRFEGAGVFSSTFGKQSVRGHLAESRITILGGSPRVQPVHLNKHVDYSTCCAPIPSTENARSVATPLDMAITSDGETLYVAAFGTSEVGVYDTAELEADTFTPTIEDQIHVSGGGPAGLALDERFGRLYVYTRFDDGISVVDTRSKREVRHFSLFNPEPWSIRAGRAFLYDAQHTSSHGDSSCSSCHIFGDLDSLAWDLGDPDGDEITNPFDGPDPNNPNGTLMFHSVPEALGLPSISRNFRPMKGPMTTQSLRGLANHGPMHWRGDRLNNEEPIAQPDSGLFDEEEAFRRFNPAFEGLNGRHEPLPDEEMQLFTNFILQVTYPPNPIRNLDDGLTAEQQAGRDFYFSDVPSDNFFNCNGCHVLDPTANAQYGVAKPGFFGTDGKLGFDFVPQMFKVPHLRNQYQKVGMFGLAENPIMVPGECEAPCVGTGESNAFLGDQIRGFGFLHDGSIDTINRFHSVGAFERNVPGVSLPNPGGFERSVEGNQQRRQVEQFLLAFDSNLKPIVGQQVTATAHNRDAARPRIALLMDRAGAGDCELIAKREGQGFLYLGDGRFQPDQGAAAPIGVRNLLNRPAPTTFTCTPRGSGLRLGIDRDLDGIYDGDED